MICDRDRARSGRDCGVSELPGLRRDQAQRLSLHTIVAGLCKDNLAATPLRASNTFSIPFHPTKWMGCALDHDDAARVQGFDRLSHGNRRPAPTEEDKIESHFAKLIIAVAIRRGIQRKAQFLSTLNRLMRFVYNELHHIEAREVPLSVNTNDDPYP